ncbi:MAG: hypothetical protein ACT4PP_00920 [Sporichthyaceae bacterium]
MNNIHRSRTQAGAADPQRRRALRALAGVGGVAAAGVVAVAAGGQSASADADKIRSRQGKSGKNGLGDVMQNAGAGMHSGPDTGFGLSSFTLNPNSVSCGVGSLGNSGGAIPMTAAIPTGLATTGPFAMMMYSTRIDRYDVDTRRNRIFVAGRMRSITTMGSQVVEDVIHPFRAEGLDHKGTRLDEFYLHFLTAFWTPASNPTATPSHLIENWAMFGSTIVLGEINVR